MGDLAQGLKAPLDLGVTSIPADSRGPMLSMGTRHNYFMKHFDVWKDYVRYKVYALVLGVLAVTFLFTQPLLAVIASFAAAYCYQIYKFCHGRTLGNQRTVMIGH